MKMNTTERSKGNFAIFVGAPSREISESKTVFRGAGSLNPMKIVTTERSKANFAIVAGALRREISESNTVFRGTG